jgi:hypothetical protein
MESTMINLSSSDYEDFLRCLTNLKDLCTDIDMRAGIIRQRSNDNNSIFEFDLTSLLQNITIPISDLKNKLDLFRIFIGQDVRIDCDDNVFSFSDQYTTVKIKKPLADFLDNKFIESTELEAIISVPDDSLILETDLKQIITERIKTITQNFNTPSVQILFEGETARILAGTQSKEQNAVLISGLITNVAIDRSISSMSINPFTIDHDGDIKLEIYRDQNNILNKFETLVGQIPIKMFSKSLLRIENEE